MRRSCVKDWPVKRFRPPEGVEDLERYMVLAGLIALVICAGAIDWILVERPRQEPCRFVLLVGEYLKAAHKKVCPVIKVKE